MSDIENVTPENNQDNNNSGGGDAYDPSITPVDINHEMKEAYLQYSMSVIVGRALPDVRDGLKPVHRRILFAMHDLKNHHDKPYKKSARVVGDVIGKYHPHGDTAVYDTMVRMAQDFSMREMLVDGQGNFGSIDGDSPAAQRYTEVRMTKLSEELLEDIEKETVSFGPNYDDSLLIPSVLPAKYPNLLVNGSAGIAVGMATNIPPHNLGEVIDGCMSLIDNPKLTEADLYKIIPGPDFPTSGIISGTNGIKKAYNTGKGIISLKAVADIETKKDIDYIVIQELPYQVNKAKLIESIANLVRDKKLIGISEIRDESNREGIRVVIRLKRGENPQVILNQLYKYTQMKVSFGIIFLALNDKNQPKLFTVKAILEAFINHRRDVVTRRSLFELKKAKARAHILEGLKKALDIIDQIIKTIRAAKESSEAKASLMDDYQFSEIQAKAILEMRLQRLTGLERDKIIAELKVVMDRIAELEKVLSDLQEVYKIIKEELTYIKEKFATPRKTKIEAEMAELEDEDLIAKEDAVVSMTHRGNIKRIPTSQYKLQKRGGKGLKGAVSSTDEDFVSKIFVTDTLTNLLFFTDKGKLFWEKVFRLPQGSRTSKGRSIKNVIQLGAKENVCSILQVKEYSENETVVLVTTNGTIKKTSLSEFSKPRPSGIIALKLNLDDQVVSSTLSGGSDHIFIVTKNGQSIRFDESDVRRMGRSAKGVKGIALGKEDLVVCAEVIKPDDKGTVLIVTSNGYGKRTDLSEYRTQSRGGVGIITQKVTDKVGHVINASKVSDTDQVMITTNQGQSIRMKATDISTFGRNTQGVRLINLKPGEFVTGFAVIAEPEEATSEEEAAN